MRWSCPDCGTVTEQDECPVCGSPRTAGVAYPDAGVPPAPARGSSPAPPLPAAPARASPTTLDGRSGPAVRRSPNRLPILLAVVVAVAAAGVAYAAVEPSPGTPTAVETPTAGPALEPFTPSHAMPETSPTFDDGPPTEPLPERTVGLVAIRDTVTDWRAEDVARMFDTYFSAINRADYAAAAAVFDPAGSFDPRDPRQLRRFAAGLATTTDSDIVLSALATDITGQLVANVSFQSSQEPGYGPRGRESETCTRWDVAYTLTETAPGEWLINRSRGSSTPC